MMRIRIIQKIRGYGEDDYAALNCNELVDWENNQIVIPAIKPFVGVTIPIVHLIERREDRLEFDTDRPQWNCSISLTSVLNNYFRVNKLLAETHEMTYHK